MVVVQADPAYTVSTVTSTVDVGKVNVVERNTRPCNWFKTVKDPCAIEVTVEKVTDNNSVWLRYMICFCTRIVLVFAPFIGIFFVYSIN